MDLCKIPTSQIHNVEIPTGLPLIFDHRVNRLRLLEDDDDPTNLFLKHNFGASLELLFKPEFMSTEDFNKVIQVVASPPTSAISGGTGDAPKGSHGGSVTVDVDFGSTKEAVGAQEATGEGSQDKKVSYDPILRLRRK